MRAATIVEVCMRNSNGGGPRRQQWRWRQQQWRWRHYKAPMVLEAATVGMYATTIAEMDSAAMGVDSATIERVETSGFSTSG